jgi:phosphate transport system protein
LARLLDIGKDRISNIMMEMAELSEQCVATAIDSYEKGSSAKNPIFQWSEELRVLQSEVSELAIELIARYQPVASDLRFIRSCLEISYGFSRFGRYAYDIVDVLETMGSVSHCDKKPVLDMASIARDMICQSVQALRSNDERAAEKLYQMDNSVDALYRKRLREVITPSQPPNTAKTDNELSSSSYKVSDPRCHVSALLIMRFLERISDHACHIADSVHYIVTGTPSPRR